MCNINSYCLLGNGFASAPQLNVTCLGVISLIPISSEEMKSTGPSSCTEECCVSFAGYVLRSLISQETVGRYDIYKCLDTPKQYTLESRGARYVVG
jgi:hypothetical protein